MNKIYSDIGRLIMTYDKHFKAFMKKELASSGLNVAEAMVMMALYEKDGQTQDQLLHELSYDKSVMTRVIQSLEAAGMIYRTQNTEDGRSWIMNLTPEGISVKRKILSALRKWCTIAFEGIDDESAAQLLSVLMTVRDNIKDT